MVTYEQWNGAIISHLFDHREPGEVVFLQTNSETLVEIAEQCEFRVENAAESLTAAIRHKVLVYGNIALWRIRPSDLQEPYPEAEPSQVAFLALTVLAASLMESSDKVFHTNYYARLNQLLFGKTHSGRPKGLEYRQFEDYWLHVQRWASHQHDIELHLTTGPQNQRYVWYPISQCLICNHDRRSLYQFFRDNALHPFSNLSNRELQARLRYSASRFSAKIRRHLQREQYAQSIVGQTQSLLRNWDGQVPTASPRKGSRNTSTSVDVELRFSLSGHIEIRYWFPRRGMAATRLQQNALGIDGLESFESEKWFQPVQDEQHMFWDIRRECQLLTDESDPVIYILNLSEDVWVFRRDPERDEGWLSQRNLQLHEEYLVLFRVRFAEKIIAYLESCCNEQIESSDIVPVGDGWAYLRARPIASACNPEPELWRLSVESSRHIRFIDGLVIKDPDGHRAYLDVCLPRVLVPKLGLPSSEPLHVGEQTFAVDADGFVKLDNGLGAGIHLLSYGNKTAELRIRSPEHSLEYETGALVANLAQETTVMLAYTDRTIAEISAQPGVWLAGARLMGQGSPKVTWADMQVEPEPEDRGSDQPFRSPAEVISLTVKAAVALKQNQAPVPEWLGQVIARLSQNTVLRVSVEKKLSQYGEMALTYQELCQLGAIVYEPQTIP